MSNSKITLGTMLVVFGLILGLPLKVGAVDFSGKSVTLSIAFSVGGGSDRWARVYAPYLSKYLPGNPTVVVRNMPGGGVSFLISAVGGEITLAECVGFGRRGIYLRCGDFLDHDAPLARGTHSRVE